MGVSRSTRAAFSLVELVVVVIIIALLAAMAIPRLSRASDGAGTAAMQRTMQVLQRAIHHYAAEHNNTFPGEKSDGSNAAFSARAFANQLTMFTDVNGRVSTVRTAVYKFGPYLARGIPVVPIGKKSGLRSVLVDDRKATPEPDDGSTAAWIYNPQTGAIVVNDTDVVDALAAASAD